MGIMKDWKPTRDQKGLIMGAWLLLASVNGMLFLFNLSLWLNSMHDDSVLLFMNLGSMLLCIYMQGVVGKLETKD